MTHLFIEASGVWMFRDGRPFDAGIHYRAVSLFPPPPTVLQGALRSKHLSVIQADLAEYARGQGPAIEQIGYAHESYGRFRMSGPFVARTENAQVWRYFPQPADAVQVGETYQPARPRDEARVQVGLPAGLKLLWAPPGAQRGKTGEPKWWREDALQAYWTEGQVALDHPAIVCEDELVVRESHVGIDYDDETGTVFEGLLYVAEYIRPRPGVGLEVEVTDALMDAWPDRGMLSLGGDGRTASYRKISSPPGDKPHCLDGSRFKLYLATPAYLEGGWQPTRGDWSLLFGADVDCVGAAIGRAFTAGGYDLIRKDHKPARRYVPAGSVYYFDSSPQQLRLPERITQWGEAIGLGDYIIGGWE